MNLALPALRERSDRAELIDKLLAAQAGARGLRLDIHARQCLFDYPWPGNIRQLLNSLRYAVALAEDGVIDVDCLPCELLAPQRLPLPSGATPQAGNLEKQLGGEESRRLLGTLRRHRWNISSAATDLGISRSTLYRKMKKHGVVAPNDQP
jgi:transcriptional regulator of acetoin/glycerol metabolism